MNKSNFCDLAKKVINNELPSKNELTAILQTPQKDLLKLMDAAYEVRHHYFGNRVQVHIINNTQNGYCPEDCNYCAQSKDSKADIAPYGMKSEEEVLAEAKKAYDSGAFRYCMVFSGTGPAKSRVKQLSKLVKEIKSKYPLEVCVSAGLFKDSSDLKTLKEAGLDRLNHNLNTSEKMYPEICSTHTFQDRIDTLSNAKGVGLDVCSGMIAGMGESDDDIYSIALKLREIQAPSIPINFLVPIEGNPLSIPQNLTPARCLSILAFFRFTNPKAEIRVAAGREGHLRSLESLSLYPANSLFLEGYLNTKGGRTKRVFQMIHDAGFEIDSHLKASQLLEQEGVFTLSDQDKLLKSRDDLRPLEKMPTL